MKELHFQLFEVGQILTFKSSLLLELVGNSTNTNSTKYKIFCPVLSVKYMKRITLIVLCKFRYMLKGCVLVRVQCQCLKDLTNCYSNTKLFSKRLPHFPSIDLASDVKHHSCLVSTVTVICDVLTRWKLSACISVCLLFRMFKGKILCQDLRLTPNSLNYAPYNFHYLIK